MFGNENGVVMVHENRILRKYGFDEEKQFWWGKVSSDFDQKSCISSIVFAYSPVLR